MIKLNLARYRYRLPRLYSSVPAATSGGQKSYSLSGEDRILAHILQSLNVSRVNYIDIGAKQPNKDNNSYFFYCNGGRGLIIDPDELQCEKFKTQRPDDVVINAVVSETRAELNFYRFAPNNLSTMNESSADYLLKSGMCKLMEKVKIKTLPLAELIQDYYFEDELHVLSVAGETNNANMFDGLSTLSKKPATICVETLQHDVLGKPSKNLEIIENITSQGYMHYADTFINSIFVLKTDWLSK